MSAPRYVALSYVVNDERPRLINDRQEFASLSAARRYAREIVNAKRAGRRDGSTGSPGLGVVYSVQSFSDGQNRVAVVLDRVKADRDLTSARAHMRDARNLVHCGRDITPDTADLIYRYKARDIAECVARLIRFA